MQDKEESSIMPKRTYNLSDKALKKLQRMADKEQRDLQVVLERIIMQATESM